MTLPIRASEHYSNLTVATRISNQDLSSQQPIKPENTEVASHTHSVQANQQVFENVEGSEMIDFENVKYASNFGSLPSHIQKSLMESDDQTLSVNELLYEANVQGRSPETENELEFCNKCFVYKNKCICPSPCSSCHQLKTKDSMCLCDKEFVSSLSAKIEKHFEDDELTQEELQA